MDLFNKKINLKYLFLFEYIFRIEFIPVIKAEFSESLLQKSF